MKFIKINLNIYLWMNLNYEWKYRLVDSQYFHCILYSPSIETISIIIHSCLFFFANRFIRIMRMCSRRLPPKNVDRLDGRSRYPVQHLRNASIPYIYIYYMSIDRKPNKREWWMHISRYLGAQNLILCVVAIRCTHPVDHFHIQYYY